jgi:hypothetical protein
MKPQKYRVELEMLAFCLVIGGVSAAMMMTSEGVTRLLILLAVLTPASIGYVSYRWGYSSVTVAKSRDATKEIIEKMNFAEVSQGLFRFQGHKPYWAMDIRISDGSSEVLVEGSRKDMRNLKNFV